MTRAFCSLPVRYVNPAENARSHTSMQIQTNVTPIYSRPTRKGFPPRRFGFHYSKPASRAAGRNVLSVHWQGKCHLVNHVLCAAKIETHHQKRQPHCILRGFARQVMIFGGVGKWRGGMVAHIVP